MDRADSRHCEDLSSALELGVAARGGQSIVSRTPREGEPHLRRGRRLHRVEDQPPRWNRYPAKAVATASSAARRAQPFAAAAEERGGSLERLSAAATALASAPTVKGLRSSS